MEKEVKQKLTTKQLAVCGIMLAVSIVLLYLASIIPGIELTLMAVVGALVYLIAENCSFRIGRIFYVATVLAALILSPGKIIILPYIFCLGPYALIKYGAEKNTFKSEEGQEKNNSKKQYNKVDIRLSDDENFVSYKDESGYKDDRVLDEEKKRSLKNSKVGKYVVEYLIKITGFAACVAIFALFVMFVMGLSPAVILDGISGNIESNLIAKIGEGLSYVVIVIAVIVVLILYDNIIRLLNAVFGKHLK